jgi:hypothetical protein
LVFWLVQIGSEQKGVSRLEDSPDLGQKFQPCDPIKIPDGAAKKQHKQMLATLATGSDLQQAIEILALKTYDADGIDVAEFALTPSQSRTGYLDGEVTGGPAATERFKQPTSFLAAAAAQFNDSNVPGKAINNFARVAPQQSFVGASEPVLG